MENCKKSLAPRAEENSTIRNTLKREQGGSRCFRRGSTDQPSSLTDQITSFVGKLWANRT